VYKYTVTFINSSFLSFLPSNGGLVMVLFAILVIIGLFIIGSYLENIKDLLSKQNILQKYILGELQKLNNKGE
jgi:Tfp pilus assembly protein PilN